MQKLILIFLFFLTMAYVTIAGLLTQKVADAAIDHKAAQRHEKLIAIVGIETDQVSLQTGITWPVKLKLRRPLQSGEFVRPEFEPGLRGVNSYVLQPVGTGDPLIARATIFFQQPSAGTRICFWVMLNNGAKVEEPDCVTVMVSGVPAPPPQPRPHFELPGTGGPLVARLFNCKILIFRYIIQVHY